MVNVSAHIISPHIYFHRVAKEENHSSSMEHSDSDAFTEDESFMSEQLEEIGLICTCHFCIGIIFLVV